MALTPIRRRGSSPRAARGDVAVAPRWFLTGPASEEDLISREPRTSELVRHAKAMGTNTTACGLVTTSWTKMWAVPFETAPSGSRCAACTSQVAAALRTAPAHAWPGEAPSA